MKIFLFLLLNSCCLHAAAQTNSDLQKSWQIISMEVADCCVLNTERNDISYKASFDTLFSKDNDPKMSRQIFAMAMQSTLKMIRSRTISFSADSVYTEKNSKTSKLRKGIYQLTGNQLVITESGEKREYTVSFAEGKLTLAGTAENAGGGSGKITTVYEEVK